MIHTTGSHDLSDPIALYRIRPTSFTTYAAGKSAKGPGDGLRMIEVCTAAGLRALFCESHALDL